jgi:hypothetical protein
MIAGIFHQGSGLGDQLHRYITVRSLAEKRGVDWCMAHPNNFKGKDFMPLKMWGSDNPDVSVLVSQWNEKETKENGVDIRSYDPEINFIEDNTLIDGSFEDDKYWRWNLDTISTWLQVEPVEVPDDRCLIGFRGGEYYSDPHLGLPKTYFATAMNRPEIIGKGFEVHTDDPALARDYLQVDNVVENRPISHSQHSNMGYNWRSMRYAKYAIIPNSAFYILPRLLKHHEDPEAVTIAPRYWARRNTKTWARPACYYPEFTYV